MNETAEFIDQETYDEGAAAHASQAAASATRRNHCRGSLLAFCQTYFPETFTGWTDGQLDIVATIENVILNGGSADREVQRGTGSTTLLLTGALWAGLMEHRRGILVILDNSQFALHATQHMSMAVAHSDDITKDFPNALYKISECIRNRTCKQNLTTPFRSSGEVIKPDLVLIDSVAGDEWNPAGQRVQDLAQTAVAAVRVTSVER